MAVDYKLRAEVLGAMLELRLVDEVDVVRWADEVVDGDEEPDPALLAISVDSRGARVFAADLTRALARVAGRATRTEVTNALLGVVARRLARDRGFSRKAEAALFRILSPVDPVKTPAGLELGPFDEEARDHYRVIDRELARLSVESWPGVMGSFLQEYAPFAEHMPFA